jgi:hypothetical protein
MEFLNDLFSCIGSGTPIAILYHVCIVSVYYVIHYVYIYYFVKSILVLDSNCATVKEVYLIKIYGY